MNESDGFAASWPLGCISASFVAVPGRAGCAVLDGMEEMRAFEWTTITALRRWLSTNQHIKTNCPDIIIRPRRKNTHKTFPSYPTLLKIISSSSQK